MGDRGRCASTSRGETGKPFQCTHTTPVRDQPDHPPDVIIESSYGQKSASAGVCSPSRVAGGAAAGRDGTFSVSLIPTTLQLTTLGLKGPGDVVNLEVDVLAKYVERMLQLPVGEENR